MLNAISNLFEGGFIFARDIFRILSNIWLNVFAKNRYGWLPLFCFFFAIKLYNWYLTGFQISFFYALHRQWQWFESLLVSYDSPLGSLEALQKVRLNYFSQAWAWYSQAKRSLKSDSQAKIAVCSNTHRSQSDFKERISNLLFFFQHILLKKQ